MYPIMIISGAAGSGKDSFAAAILKTWPNGVVLAQADVMKRFVAKVFGFTKEQLWGPSENRNLVDPRYSHVPVSEFDMACDRAYMLEQEFELELGIYSSTLGGEALEKWLDTLHDLMIKGQGLSPRITLQLLGTEFGRQLDKNIWSNYAIKTAEKLLGGGYLYTPELGLIPTTGGVDGPEFVIISDGRFRNEILNVKMIGGQAIKIIDDSPPWLRGSPQAPGIKGHTSETEVKEIPRHWFDHTVHNRKISLEDLEYEAKLAIEQLGFFTVV